MPPIFKNAMAKYTRPLIAMFTLALVAACSSGNQPPAELPAPPADVPMEADADPTTADGIFTVAQAERGEALFRSTCSECHDSADWTETGFKGRWEEQSVCVGLYQHYPPRLAEGGGLASRSITPEFDPNW